MRPLRSDVVVLDVGPEAIADEFKAVSVLLGPPGLWAFVPGRNLHVLPA